MYYCIQVNVMYLPVWARLCVGRGHAYLMKYFWQVKLWSCVNFYKGLFLATTHKANMLHVNMLTECCVWVVSGITTKYNRMILYYISWISMTDDHDLRVTAVWKDLNSTDIYDQWLYVSIGVIHGQWSYTVTFHIQWLYTDKKIQSWSDHGCFSHNQINLLQRSIYSRDQSTPEIDLLHKSL